MRAACSALICELSRSVTLASGQEDALVRSTFELAFDFNNSLQIKNGVAEMI